MVLTIYTYPPPISTSHEFIRMVSSPRLPYVKKKRHPVRATRPGNVLVDKPGADIANLAAMNVDLRQARNGRVESFAELRDDTAGIAVGNAMVRTTRAGKSADDYAGLARTIMNILCI